MGCIMYQRTILFKREKEKENRIHVCSHNILTYLVLAVPYGQCNLDIYSP